MSPMRVNKLIIFFTPKSKSGNVNGLLGSAPTPTSHAATFAVNRLVFSPSELPPGRVLLLPRSRRRRVLGSWVEDQKEAPPAAGVSSGPPGKKMRAGETASDAEDPVDFWDAQWFGPTGAAPRRRLKLDMGSACRPKNGEDSLGEDAHFVSEARNAFGVADGVGAWSREGVDAGEFARQLMSSCKAELERSGGGRATGAALRGVLKKALATTTARGTSTACIAAVDGRHLRAVNVGDSGFMVVRGDAVPYRSPLNQYSFNFPCQIGGVDKATPLERAVQLATELAPGDVVVAGSDGLFDNLFEEDIVEIVARKRAEGLGGTAEETARALAAAAEDAYVTGQETPFGAASRAAGISWSGGKQDDVTVVVAKVECASNSSEAEEEDDGGDAVDRGESLGVFSSVSSSLSGIVRWMRDACSGGWSAEEPQ